MSNNTTTVRNIYNPLHQVAYNLLKDIGIRSFRREEVSGACLKTRESIGHLKTGFDALNKQIVPIENRVDLQKLCLYLVALLEGDLLGLYKKEHSQLILKDFAMLELLNLAAKPVRLAVNSAIYCIDYNNSLIYKTLKTALKLKIRPRSEFFINGVKIDGEDVTVLIKITSDNGVKLVIHYHCNDKEPLKIGMEQMQDVHWDHKNNANHFTLTLELKEIGDDATIRRYVNLDFPTKMQQILFYCFLKPRVFGREHLFICKNNKMSDPVCFGNIQFENEHGFIMVITQEGQHEDKKIIIYSIVDRFKAPLEFQIRQITNVPPERNSSENLLVSLDVEDILEEGEEEPAVRNVNITFPNMHKKQNFLSLIKADSDESGTWSPRKNHLRMNEKYSRLKKP